jgi:hypothetical protein
MTTCSLPSHFFLQPHQDSLVPALTLHCLDSGTSSPSTAPTTRERGRWGACCSQVQGIHQCCIVCIPVLTTDRKKHICCTETHEKVSRGDERRCSCIACKRLVTGRSFFARWFCAGSYIMASRIQECEVIIPNCCGFSSDSD